MKIYKVSIYENDDLIGDEYYTHKATALRDIQGFLSDTEMMIVKDITAHESLCHLDGYECGDKHAYIDEVTVIEENVA